MGYPVIVCGVPNSWCEKEEDVVRRIVLVLLVVSCVAGSAFGDMTLYQGAASSIGAVATNGEQKIGDGSWQANGSAKSSLSLTPEALFGRSITVGELASISWFTNDSADNNYEWYLSVYTVGDRSGWYDSRFTLETLYANNYSNPAGTWTQWSTDGGANQLTVYDATHGTVYGFYGGPTLADMTGGSIDWSAYPTSGSTDEVNYRDQVVGVLVWETAGGWADEYTGYLDCLTVELTNGDSAVVDLEMTPVPTPSAFVLGAMGLGFAGWIKKRRKV